MCKNSVEATVAEIEYEREREEGDEDREEKGDRLPCVLLYRSL